MIVSRHYNSSCRWRKSYTNDWALNPLLDEAVEKGVPSRKQAEYAKGKQCLAIDLVHELLDEAETADAMPEEKAKLALAVAEPFHIEGMMVISTGHVSANHHEGS